jgi:hypothetical protein
VVRSGNVVMSVGFNTFNCVVRVKVKLFKHFFVDGVVEWHEFTLGEETLLCFVFELAVPWVGLNVFDRVTVFRSNF